jgi:hypothetical protein
MYQCVGASEQRFGRRDVQRLGQAEMVEHPHD